MTRRKGSFLVTKAHNATQIVKPSSAILFFVKLRGSCARGLFPAGLSRPSFFARLQVRIFHKNCPLFSPNYRILAFLFISYFGCAALYVFLLLIPFFFKFFKLPTAEVNVSFCQDKKFHKFQIAVCRPAACTLTLFTDGT